MAPERAEPTATDVFTEHRELLFAIVYGMLGTVADTEDVLQETWLSWEARSHGEPVEHPRAYLARVAINTAIARQDAVRRRRETYIGPWLPEPLPTADQPAGSAEADVIRNESVSMALMVVLESLTPAERAVFVLREVFGYGLNEIAAMLGRSPAATRQIAHRARSHVQARRPRNDVDPRVHREVTERFMTAVRGGDVDALLDLLAPEVVLTCDGGGKAPAVGPRPVHGAQSVAARLVNPVFGRVEGFEMDLMAVNGAPSALMLVQDQIVGVVMLDLDGDRVVGVYAVTNPDKLAALR